MKIKLLLALSCLVHSHCFSAVIQPPSRIDIWGGNTDAGVTNVIKSIAGTSTNSYGDMKGASNLTDVASSGLSRTNIGANNGSNITQGTVADSRLSANVAFLTDVGASTNANSITASVNSTNLPKLAAMGVTTNAYVDSAVASASNNVDAVKIAGTIAEARLPAVHTVSNAFVDIGVSGSQSVGTLVVTNAYLNLATSSNLPFSGVVGLGPLARSNASSIFLTNITIVGSVGGTNQTWTDAAGWHNTNSGAAGWGVDIAKGNVRSATHSFTTNNLTLLVDFTAGNYVFITTNNNLTISGFTGIDAGVASVQWQVHSVSNSAATAITYGWPAGVTLYGTNSGTSISIPGGKKLKATFSVDPHGTNLCALTSN